MVRQSPNPVGRDRGVTPERQEQSRTGRRPGQYLETADKTLDRGTWPKAFLMSVAANAKASGEVGAGDEGVFFHNLI